MKMRNDLIKKNVKNIEEQSGKMLIYVGKIKVYFECTKQYESMVKAINQNNK